jgi:type I restriction enzyme R subunit
MHAPPNLLDPSPRSRTIFAFHRPEELLRLVGLDRQVRQALTERPPLEDPKLWRVQAEAITNLEQSLSQNRPRSLVQMATGSGKTFTAISASYRLIKFGGAKRVLFLVDRTNLGRQTYREFQQYESPVNRLRFTDEYNVQHLTKNTLDPVSRVCITTIQRLYSMLKGEAEFDEANEEGSMFETAASLLKEPVPVQYNPKVPIEAFDFIIADECHRSIYNLWRQVLEYFDAFLVGLTATPTKQTIGFFNNNLVMMLGFLLQTASVYGDADPDLVLLAGLEVLLQGRDHDRLDHPRLPGQPLSCSGVARSSASFVLEGCSHSSSVQD